VQLKQDYSWELMQEADLREECSSKGIPLPDGQEAGSLDRAMRSRLRQVLRWEMLPEQQLKRACELRHFATEGKSREAMLSFLRSFKILQKPKAGPAAQAPAQQRRRPQSDGPQLPHFLSDRVRRICAKYPGFQGEYPPEMEAWTDQDVEMYLYSNGNLKPNKKKAQASKVPLSVHYRTLDLPSNATPTEVRKAFRKKALIYHPDKNLQDPEAAAENFRVVTEAYEALTANFEEKG